MTILIPESALRARNEILVGMSAADVAERRNYVGASDANIIMSGDEAKIHRLWQEKCGLIEPEDLSDVLIVQMGIWTEIFNIFWFTKQTGCTVTNRQGKIVHPDRPYLRATLDGETVWNGKETVIDAKHCAPFSYDVGEIAQKYGPQMAVQMACRGVERAILSIFIGNTSWEMHVIERDPLYEAQVLGACAKFWACVKTGMSPVDMPTANAPMPVGMMRKVNMVGNNEWGSYEAQYVAHEENAKSFEEAKKTLKGMVEDDVGEAKGRLLCIKRGSNGALRFSKVKP